MSTDRKYIARAIAWAFTEAKTGTPQAFVEFKTKDTGDRYSGFFALTPKAFDRTMEGLSNCGYQGTDLVNDLERADCGLDKNDVEIVVEDHEWDGKTQERVKWINKLGGSFAPLSADKKASFAQEMKARALAYRQTQPTRTGPNKAADEPPAGHPANADIPF